VNWEAIVGFTVASVLLCALLSAIVIGSRRRKPERTVPLEVVVPKAGLVIHALQVVGMLAGIFIYALVPETPYGWARWLFCLLYFPGVFGVTVSILHLLQRRGITVIGTHVDSAPPNTSLGRTRER
jgi:hypothetical protein